MIWQQAAVIRHSQRLCNSFQRWTGRPLIDTDRSPEDLAQALFQAPFVVVSHGTQTDPIFNYGNQAALDLWQTDWQTFTQTPSRAPVNPGEEQERAKLLASAYTNGFADNYTGIRISKQGQRFWIKNVLLWTVLDEADRPIGQAATFSEWELIDGN